MSTDLRVLIVDDLEDDAMLVLRELRKGGYTVTQERVDTAAALRAALVRPWDIVVSDWSMPAGFNGLAAFHIVREVDADLPFIMVSGTISEELAVDALKAGVQDFMSKGKLARLIPTIQRELREAEVRRRQRRTDAEVERQREELARSERLLREVLHAAPDAVVVADQHMRLLTWNSAAALQLGLAVEDLGGDAWLGRYTLFQPDKVTPVGLPDRPISIALRGTAVDRESWFLRSPSKPEGAWVSVSARPLGEAAAIYGTVLLFRDVTGERTAQEQLMVSERMASMGMLAAGIAHEINNPLAAALANLEMAVSMFDQPPGPQPADLPELHEMIADAHQATNRVREIVRDVKIFSRHQEDEVGSTDLRGTLESSLRLAWNEIRHRARLTKDLPDLPRVKGSESRLGQVFLNLIVNAAQAIPEGHAESNWIRVTAQLDGPCVVVEVTDSGCGMSPEVQRQLFTPFFTTKPQGIGTGLGLAICHRIVTGLGGSIRVDSAPGRGTTFWIVLPVATAPERRRTRESHRPTPGPRGRVLVIDDEALITTAVRRILADHHVQTTTSATQALEHVRAGEAFDVILCDLMMPQISGMEFYDQVLELRRELADRIIFMTGEAFTGAARAFLDRVPNERIEKPFEAAHLRALINGRMK